MCGIVGVLHTEAQKQPVSEKQLETMRDTMVHRGPDDQGIFISKDKNVALGFRRLSILDLSEAGHQPMMTPDKQIAMVFNGEVYNHQDTRDELIDKGYSFKSHSDTETILYDYAEKGIDCIYDFRGMFAIAIWDERKEELFLARDRVGKKPIYWTFVNGKFIFASEIKALIEHPDVIADIDEESLYHYLSFLVVPAPKTLFAGINKIPAGWAMKVTKSGQIKQWQYWDPIVPRPANWEKDYFDENYCIERIRSHLEESVKLRMASDVPTGVFLSGGIDSSTNVHYFKKFSNGPVKTFCVGFKEYEQYNEFQYARMVADRYQTEHHEIMIDHNDMLNYLPNMIHQQDEPISDPVNIPLYYVSKLIRDNGVIVAQVGEGSDELFSGYEGYLQIANLYLDRWRYLDKMPRLAREAMYQGGKFWFEKRGTNLGIEYLRRLANEEPFFWGGAVTFTEWDKQRLLDIDYRNRLTTKSSLEAIMPYYEKIAREKPDSDFLERMVYLELKLRLPELLLMRVDKITMSTSIESRTPFLDHKLIEFAMNIPWQLKIKNRVPKYILKKAVEGLIPNEIIYRKKMGFGAPINEWFIRELGDYFQDTILTSSIRKREFFNYDYVRNLIETQRSGKMNVSFPLWTLFNLSLWYDHWIGKKNN